MKKIFLVAAVATLSCGGGKSVKASGDVAPDWVAQGTGEVNAEGGKKMQGVGSASGPDATTFPSEIITRLSASRVTSSITWLT